MYDGLVLYETSEDLFLTQCHQENAELNLIFCGMSLHIDGSAGA